MSKCSYLNLVSAAVVAICTSAASTANAEGLYGSLSLGWSSEGADAKAYGDNIAVDPDFPGKFDGGDGSTGALGLGYVINDQFRVEGRLARHRNEFNSQRFGTGARDGEEYILDGTMKSMSLTVEVFYDIPTSVPFSPYIKAGIGIARNKYAAQLGGAGVAAFDAFDGVSDGFYDAYPDQTSTEFAWNVGFGGSYKLKDTFDLFGEYQYMSLGDGQTGQDEFTDGFGIESGIHTVMIGIRTRF